ncbi:hypothetical protein VTH06DRAFT_13 [Thermothelomyces fergusii]
MRDRLKIVLQSAGRQLSHSLDDDRKRVGLGISYGAQNSPPLARGDGSSIKGGPAPPRPPRDFFESRYETVPPVGEPPRRNPNCAAACAASFRPTSSVCSENSTLSVSSYAANYTATVATEYSYRYGGADEISPPSSPDPDDRQVDRFLPADVSPIDEDDWPEHHHAVGVPPNAGAPVNDGPGWPYVPGQRPAPQSPARNCETASIPAMRRERGRHSDTGTRDPGASQPGAAPQLTPSPPPPDQTNSAHARPAQAGPAEHARGRGLTSQAWLEPRKSPTALSQSFADRVRRIAKKAAAARDGNTDPAAGAFTSPRPPWRGASGRTAIVDPVHDSAKVPRLQIPVKKSNKRNPASTPDGPVRRGQTPPVSPPASETPTRSAARDVIKRILPGAHSPAATQTQHHQTAQGHPSPPPPLPENPAREDPPDVAAAQGVVCDGHGGSPARPGPPWQPPESPNQFRRKPPPGQANHPQHQHQPSVSSVHSQQSSAPQLAPLLLPNDWQSVEDAKEEPYVPPPSRFSITTSATNSNTGTTREDTDEHPDEGRRPVPSLPAGDHHHHNDDDKNNNNNSPVASSPQSTAPGNQPSPAGTEWQAPPLASTSTAGAATTSAAPAAQDRPSARPSDVNKSLPPAPPEQSADRARDRVGLLEARLRALANRRINIDRSIQQMTQRMMPTMTTTTTTTMTDSAEAEAVRCKVDALRRELADVQREERELGLKLHRAYKRLDRESEWEPTTLWVRRVTG